jgi:putative Mg2+ transporter-C (MgtC) family protein
MMWDFILRLFVAGILGAVVGLDREYRAKEAGYRTHFLVSLGSALIMVVSQYGFQDVILENSVSLDPSRVAAQVVSGIGFIGAGTIIIQKQFVRGLTTAAGMGDRRYRSGRRLRHVRARYRRHFVDARRAGAVERYF